MLAPTWQVLRKKDTGNEAPKRRNREKLVANQLP